VLYRYQYTHSLCAQGRLYDGVGNRLTETNTGQITYTYDNNNRLTQLVGPSGTTTFGYDNNGNTTSMVQPGPVTTTYGYDYENRLASVINPTYTAAYTYSADGLRLRVQESNAQYPDRWLQPLGPFGAGVAAQRVQPYDGVRPVLEGTLSGDTYTTTAKYVWEGNGYYDPLVYSLIGGAWRYHLYDGLGSTRQLLQHLSPYSVTDTYQYEAFGNLLSSTGTTPNLARSRPPVGERDRHGGAARPHLATYRYVGSLGYYATGSSLMHLGARYYMPEMGRFLQRDPEGNAPEPYAYAGHDPIVSVDPSGRKPPTIGPYHPSPRYGPIPDPGPPSHPRCCLTLSQGITTSSAVAPDSEDWTLTDVRAHWSGVEGFFRWYICYWQRDIHYKGRQTKVHWSIAICADPEGGYYIDRRENRATGLVDYWRTEETTTSVGVGEIAGGEGWSACETRGRP